MGLEASVLLERRAECAVFRPGGRDQTTCKSLPVVLLGADSDSCWLMPPARQSEDAFQKLRQSCIVSLSRLAARLTVSLACGVTRRDGLLAAQET